MSALRYSRGDVPGLEVLEPTVAHTLRAAIASYRTPTAARARILNHIAKAQAEVEAALKIAEIGRVKEAA